MIFSQQLISPKLLYLGNPEDLRDGVGDIFARKVMQMPNLETVFESANLKVLKLLIFSQQLISFKLLYLNNYEDLGNTLGDIFGHWLKPHKNVPEHFLLSRQKKKIKNFGRERFYERILKIFGVLKSVAQAALKCPKPLFSISRFKKSSALTIDRNV